MTTGRTRRKVMAECGTDGGRRELARRTAHGVDVSLDWRAADSVLFVSVVDSAADSTFELVVGDEDPLDVFNHPYAYAAFRGLDPVTAATGSRPRAGVGA